MAIRDVVSRGYGNGTYSGTIALVVTRGYSIGSATVPTSPGLEYTLAVMPMHYTVPEGGRLHYTSTRKPLHYTIEDDD